MNGTWMWKIPDVIKAANGKHLFGSRDAVFSRIVIDSRIAGPGDLFVAICGERFDGHDFVEEVIKKGVRGLLIARDRADRAGAFQMPASSDVVCVAVEDTVSALGGLAAFLRNRIDPKVIGITGSSGKTTTKEMTARVLLKPYSTLFTTGNLNNAIGVPLTLLSLRQSHDVAVIEMGMNHPGEIRRLSGIAGPDIGIITNIGPVHLAGVGSVDAVADAKAEMFENIRPGGTVVLNADDPYGRQLARRTENRVVFFGMDPNADVRAENIRENETDIAFDLLLPEARTPARVRGWGKFLVHNALAAAAAGHLMGLDAETIASGLLQFYPVAGRMSVFKTENGVYVIDDTYNANPDSMSAAISVLAAGKRPGLKILVAGDMMELGGAAPGFHEQVGRLAAQGGVSRLYLTGQYAARTAFGARKDGMSGNDIFVGTCEDILKDLNAIVGPGDSVLIKGSRAMGMEQIARGFFAQGATPVWPSSKRER